MNEFDHILVPNQLGSNFRNDALINLQYQHVNPSQRSGATYHEICLVFQKTNKDPTKGEHGNLSEDI